jgi:hypothetical protein
LAHVGIVVLDGDEERSQRFHPFYVGQTDRGRGADARGFVFESVFESGQYVVTRRVHVKDEIGERSGARGMAS